MSRLTFFVCVLVAACGGGSETGGDGGGGGGDGAPRVDGGGLPGGADAAPIDCASETCRYVRADAAAGGDGTSWDAAFTTLPDPLERGVIYVVGAGDYAGLTIDTPADGTRRVRIVASTTEHAGPITFGPTTIEAPFVELDGRGRRITLRGDFMGTVLTIGGDDVTVRSLEIDGRFSTDGGGTHVAGACSLLESDAARLVVEDCELHDAADDGAVFYGTRNIRFEGNHLHALHGCGTDGDCGPCFNGHSDGLELFDVEGGTIRRNFIHDINSTATIFFGNWGNESEYVEDLTLENNVLYAPEVGLVAYLHYARNVRFLANTVWGESQGSYGGLAIGPEVTGLELHDNILLSINTAHTGGAYDAAEHHSSHNVFGEDVGQWPVGATDVVAADPGFADAPAVGGARLTNPTAAAFALEAGGAALDRGATSVPGVTLPADDFFGAARGATPDVGAIER